MVPAGGFPPNVRGRPPASKVLPRQLKSFPGLCGASRGLKRSPAAPSGSPLDSGAQLWTQGRNFGVAGAPFGFRGVPLASKCVPSPPKSRLRSPGTFPRRQRKPPRTQGASRGRNGRPLRRKGTLPRTMWPAWNHPERPLLGGNAPLAGTMQLGGKGLRSRFFRIARSEEGAYWKAIRNRRATKRFGKRSSRHDRSNCIVPA